MIGVEIWEWVSQILGDTCEEGKCFAVEKLVTAATPNKSEKNVGKLILGCLG